MKESRIVYVLREWRDGEWVKVFPHHEYVFKSAKEASQYAKINVSEFFRLEPVETVMRQEEYDATVFTAGWKRVNFGRPANIEWVI